MLTASVLVLMIGLAAANGANDVSRGVATLAGAGVVRYRTAIIWGTVTTLLGGLLAIVVGKAMTKLFSSGIVTADVTASFALAVLLGATAWITFATLFRLPVSTTHSIVGSLIGAGLVLSADAVDWGGVLKAVALPLFVSIFVAYGLSVLIAVVAQGIGRAFRDRPAGGGPGGGPPRADVDGDGRGLSPSTAPTAVTEHAEHEEQTTAWHRVISGLHWFSSGATNAARGLNDTPKIAAIGGFALIPAGMSPDNVMLIAAVAMTLGSLLGIRVAYTLGERVVKMSHGEGFGANAVTAVLVGFGGVVGLPMSTTHVSGGAIAGSAGLSVRRLNGKTVRDVAIAWLVTPLFAGAIAAPAFLLFG